MGIFAPLFFYMKKLILTIVLLAGMTHFVHAQITIAEARALSPGTNVTVKGLVLNGSDLGDIRYLQDNTGNIAAFACLVI